MANRFFHSFVLRVRVLSHAQSSQAGLWEAFASVDKDLSNELGVTSYEEMLLVEGFHGFEAAGGGSLGA